MLLRSHHHLQGGRGFEGTVTCRSPRRRCLSTGTVSVALKLLVVKGTQVRGTGGRVDNPIAGRHGLGAQLSFFLYDMLLSEVSVMIPHISVHSTLYRSLRTQYTHISLLIYWNACHTPGARRCFRCDVLTEGRRSGQGNSIYLAAFTVDERSSSLCFINTSGIHM